MSIRGRLRAAASALLFPDVIDVRGRAAVVAVERRVASMAAEITGYRLVLGSILQRRAQRQAIGCPECKGIDGHGAGCDFGAAEQAMKEGALRRAERGDAEGKA